MRMRQYELLKYHSNLVPRGRDPFGQRRGSGPRGPDFSSA